MARGAAIAPQYSYVDPDAPDFVQYGLEECQNAGHRKDRLKCPLDRDRFDETKSMVVDLGVLVKADALALARVPKSESSSTAFPP